MSDFDAFDLDRATARAWSQLQEQLVAHLSSMSGDDVLVIGVEADSEPDEGSAAAPYIQFANVDDGGTYLEVSSNRFLTGVHRLSPAAEETLADLGLVPPTEIADDDGPTGSPNHSMEVDADEVPRLAVIAVRVLRDILGVPHPAFLEPSSPIGVAADEDVDDDDEPEVVRPRDRAHLQELVDHALIPVFSRVPDHDDDGDIPVVAGSALVFVRVLPDVPVVQLFSSVVDHIEDLDRAAFEVGVLNRDSLFIRYVLHGDRVMAYLNVPAYPFVPEHLRATLAVMSTDADQVDDDLARRVGGRRTFESDAPAASIAPVADDDPLHPAMHTLLQLEAEAPGSVDPELAASICDHDRDLILSFLTSTAEDEIAWRQARDEALLREDPEDVEVCEGEVEQAERIGTLLRQALRIVVEAERARQQERRSRPGRARRRTAPEEASQEEPGAYS